MTEKRNQTATDVTVPSLPIFPFEVIHIMRMAAHRHCSNFPA